MLTPEQHRELMYGLCIAHITNPADARMKTRTAKEQHALALAELNREQTETVPDADDGAASRSNVLL